MEIPMYKDLVDMYNKGELNPPNNKWIFYHLNEETKALGNKYVTHDHWDNFVNGIELSKKVEKERWDRLWKTKL